MAVGFDIMNMILVKRHCLLERVWKRLSARCASQFAGMIFQIRSGDDVFFTGDFTCFGSLSMIEKGFGNFGIWVESLF